MARDFAVGFYRSKSWRVTRDAYMNSFVESDYGLIPPGVCERCFAEGKLIPAEIIHHKIHLSPTNINDNSITLDFKNLKRVCRDCHAIEHSADADYIPRVQFGPNGEVLRLNGNENS